MSAAVADRTLPAIEVSGLRKSYDHRPVLRDLSFRVAAGEIFALLGPNGAGKTTTVEIIEGYRRADRGEVRVLGVDPARAGRAHRARVGLMLQGGGGIDPRMTAREVVGLHARFHAEPRDVDELLGRVGLTGSTARTRYRRLSGGEKQRVGLALALVGRPELAILDEPTAGMDVEARAATRDLLAGLRASGVTVLLTSHDLVDVERLVDRLAILDRGRIVAIGAPQELTAASFPVLRFRLALPLAEPDRVALADRLAEAGGDSRIAIEDDGGSGRYRVDGLAPTPPIVATVASWCEARGALILELRTGGGSLEERYLELIGAAGDEPIDDDAADDVRGGRRRRRGR
ncbi:MAG TPA: ABC transporter ATP-binding protein [Candidatus Limnocylindrales bacterium]|nr:ABC transporter ATP-binding protein [Candidatus Limnocylindrales bacterium]